MDMYVSINVCMYVCTYVRMYVHREAKEAQQLRKSSQVLNGLAILFK